MGNQIQNAGDFFSEIYDKAVNYIMYGGREDPGC